MTQDCGIDFSNNERINEFLIKHFGAPWRPDYERLKEHCIKQLKAPNRQDIIEEHYTALCLLEDLRRWREGEYNHCEECCQSSNKTIQELRERIELLEGEKLLAFNTTNQLSLENKILHDKIDQLAADIEHSLETLDVSNNEEWENFINHGKEMVYCEVLDMLGKGL